jgi:hypothetical protein
MKSTYIQIGVIFAAVFFIMSLAAYSTSPKSVSNPVYRDWVTKMVIACQTKYENPTEAISCVKLAVGYNPFNG